MSEDYSASDMGGQGTNLGAREIEQVFHSRNGSAVVLAPTLSLQRLV
jgi:hypothetical protein